MVLKPVLLSVFAAGASVWGLSSVGDEKAPTHEQVCAAEQFLFVQNARSGSFDGERLTLEKVGPTIFFTDRPYRVFGQVHPGEFVAAWQKGPNSFATDPPNAVLSLIGEQNVLSCPVVLSEPRYEDGNLSYELKVEGTEVPARFQDASLFIDNEAWAAVGGFAAGHFLARRRDRELAAAHAEGAASAMQSPSYYYNAAPPSPPPVPPPPAPPPATPPPSVPELLSKATKEMESYAKTASPENAQYVQQLIKTLNSVSSDYAKVAD